MITSSYVVLVVMICCIVSLSSLEYDKICHYNYNYKCASQVNEHVTSYTKVIKLCTTKDIPKDANFNIMSDERNSSSRGVVNVDFKSPYSDCKYKISLFVNSRINNSEDCKNYEFHKDKYTEIHTLEKSVCPIYQSEAKKNEEMIIKSMESFLCKEVLNMWYEYIYTGCYALGFKDGEKYIFVGNEFLKTDYKKTEVTEPKLRCTYKSTLKKNDPSTEMVTIATDISLLAGSSGVRLEVAHNSLIYKNEKNACNKYSEHPLVSLSLGMSVGNDTDSVNDSCSLTTTMLSTGELAKTVECNFVIQNSPKSKGYCFLVHVLDERCHKNTSWKPPLKDKVPCAWTQHCIKTEVKKADISEGLENEANDVKILKMPMVLYVFATVVIILVVITITSTLVIVYCLHIKKKKIYRNGNKNVKDFEDNERVVLELGSTKSQREKLVRESGIVILYVKESLQFMSFMDHFRKSLKQLSGCDVYDWWAPEMWNDVARLGGYEWVVKMMRKDCRVVWIDTLKARTLFVANHKNSHKRFKQLKRSENDIKITDFRESVFPAIVDFAKRNNQYIEQEYQRHFVIRLETFEDADKTDDPFTDLSPHARYLIPCHLDKLCYQLSVLDVDLEDEININKIRLKKYLFYDPILDL